MGTSVSFCLQFLHELDGVLAPVRHGVDVVQRVEPVVRGLNSSTFQLNLSRS